MYYVLWHNLLSLINSCDSDLWKCLMSHSMELFRVANPDQNWTSRSSQIPALALDTASFVQEWDSSLARGCFTWFLNKKPYEAIRTSAVSHLEIILLIHFPQVLQNSSTSALNSSVSDWDILKRQIVSSKLFTQACISFTWKASVA